MPFTSTQISAAAASMIQNSRSTSTASRPAPASIEVGVSQAASASRVSGAAIRAQRRRAAAGNPKNARLPAIIDTHPPDVAR